MRSFGLPTSIREAAFKAAEALHAVEVACGNAGVDPKVLQAHEDYPFTQSIGQQVAHMRGWVEGLETEATPAVSDNERAEAMRRLAEMLPEFLADCNTTTVASIIDDVRTLACDCTRAQVDCQADGSGHGADCIGDPRCYPTPYDDVV